MSKIESEDQATNLAVSCANLLGLRYVQQAVVEDIKEHPENIEKRKDDFFELCDTALDDIFLAASKPEERILCLLININKERLSLLRYLNDLKNNDPSNISLIQKIENLANLSLQTYGKLLTAYENHQNPPSFKKKFIDVPVVLKNFDISPDVCTIKVYNFKLPPIKDKRITYQLKIYYDGSGKRTEISSDDIVRGIIAQTCFSGIQENISNPQKASRFLRHKFIFEILQTELVGILRRPTQTSLYEDKLSFSLFKNEKTVVQKFQNKTNTISFEVEAKVREPFETPQEDTDIVEVRLASDLNVNLARPPRMAATTGAVPMPTAAPLDSTTPAKPKNDQALRQTAQVPMPSKAQNKPPPAKPKNGQALRQTAQVPKPSIKAPANQSLTPEQKKEKARQILLKSNFPLIPKEELDQFIDTTTIDEMAKFFTQNAAGLNKMGLLMPDEFVEQNNALLKKKEKIQDDLDNEILSPEQYKELLVKQIDRNKSLIPTLENVALAKFIEKAVKNMEYELSTQNLNFRPK